MSTISFSLRPGTRGEIEPPTVERTPYGVLIRAEEIGLETLGRLYQDLAAEGLGWIDLGIAHVLRCCESSAKRRIFNAVTTRENAARWLTEALAQLRPDLDDLDRWLCGPDTGRASEALVFFLTGRTPPNHPPEDATPCDAESFGKCVRALDVIPDQRPRLDAVPSYAPAWAPYIARWSALETLYHAGQEAELDAVLKALERRGRSIEIHDPRGAVTTIPVAALVMPVPGGDLNDLEAFLAELDGSTDEDGNTIHLT